ncbi:DUF6098 family protein [Streptomyces sp. LS1784]|uniref:DUF6098 family protein n=1 Tax=Streptomyces sp. LS1784 TaxID=2851533 RepID=UPI0027E0AAEF|nr:DUF6098 family protein [Streptomyces sp. LS1784]
MVKYADLAASCPRSRPWVLTGRVVGAGPDHEPPTAGPLPLARLGAGGLGQTAHRYHERPAPGRDSTDRVSRRRGRAAAGHGPFAHSRPRRARRAAPVRPSTDGPLRTVRADAGPPPIARTRSDGDRNEAATGMRRRPP